MRLCLPLSVLSAVVAAAAALESPALRMVRSLQHLPSRSSLSRSTRLILARDSQASIVEQFVVAALYVVQAAFCIYCIVRRSELPPSIRAALLSSTVTNTAGAFTSTFSHVVVVATLFTAWALSFLFLSLVHMLQNRHVSINATAADRRVTQNRIFQYIHYGLFAGMVVFGTLAAVFNANLYFGDGFLEDNEL